MAILTADKNIFVDGFLIQPANINGRVYVVATSVISDRQAIIAGAKSWDKAHELICELFEVYKKGGNTAIFLEEKVEHIESKQENAAD